jgi:hypothetical protein
MRLLTSEFEKYELMLQSSINKYGNNGIGTLIVRLNYLAFIIKNQLTEEKNTVIEILLSEIKQHYNYKRPENLGAFHNKINEEVLYSFSEELFNERYKINIQENQKYIVKLNEHSPFWNSFHDLHWYLYVVDRNDDLIIFNKSIMVTDLIINRDVFTDEGTRVVHPVLVPDTLTVKTAGEISFIKKGNEVEGIVLNNKSGHFRPSAESLYHAERYLYKLFANKKVQIFTIPIGV